MKQGTIPFLSTSLLGQIWEAFQDSPTPKRVYKEGKAASIQVGVNEDFRVWHAPADDAESLFYVLIWILVLYDGPLRQERQNFDFEMSILGRWSEEIIQKLDSARSSKVAFILDPNPAVLSKHVSPYFSDLVPLTEQWRQIFRHTLYFQQPLNLDSLLEAMSCTKLVHGEHG